MKATLFKDVKLGLCAIGLGLFLASCGRNGPPLPPPGVPEDQAAPLINENTSGSFDPNNSAEEKQAQQNSYGAPNGQPVNAPLAKPRKPFILDPLL